MRSRYGDIHNEPAVGSSSQRISRALEAPCFPPALLKYSRRIDPHGAALLWTLRHAGQTDGDVIGIQRSPCFFLSTCVSSNVLLNTTEESIKTSS